MSKDGGSEIPFGGNLVICCSTGGGGDGRFSCLITDTVPDLNLVRTGQAFPMFIYEYEASVRPSESGGTEKKEQ